MIEKGGFKIKNITFTRLEETSGTCMVKTFSSEYGVGDIIPVEIKASVKNSEVSHVSVYANNLLVGITTESPYVVNFVPTEMGTYEIRAIVTSIEGKEKKSTVRELKVTSPTPTAIRTVINDESNISTTPVYNLIGVPVSAGYRGIVIKNGKKFFVK